MDKKFLFYLIKRVLLAILTIFLVITITFFIMHAIPGGPFAAEKAPSPEIMAALEAKYGLDKPVFDTEIISDNELTYIYATTMKTDDIKKYIMDDHLDWIKLKKYLEEDCVLPMNVFRQMIERLQKS